MSIYWSEALIVLIVHFKTVLYVGYNCCFYTSVRANDVGEDVVGLNSNIKLFRDADLCMIRYSGVRLKKTTRIGINASVYFNSLFLEFVILVYRLNVVRAFCNVFSARSCLYSWTPVSYILFIELSYRKF
jgi:hypothetical protein